MSVVSALRQLGILSDRAICSLGEQERNSVCQARVGIRRPNTIHK